MIGREDKDGRLA